MAKKHTFKVIKDTREQTGYTFLNYEQCSGMTVRKLDTGDYTLEGLEDKLCVERKGCVEELALNLGKNRATFMREVERMREFDYKYLVLEFSLEEVMEFPNSARIPMEMQGQVKISGKFILKSLMELQINEDIHVIFCGDKIGAFYFVTSLFKRLSEKYSLGVASGK